MTSPFIERDVRRILCLTAAHHAIRRPSLPLCCVCCCSHLFVAFFLRSVCSPIRFIHAFFLASASLLQPFLISVSPSFFRSPAEGRALSLKPCFQASFVRRLSLLQPLPVSSFRQAVRRTGCRLLAFPPPFSSAEFQNRSLASMFLWSAIGEFAAERTELRTPDNEYRLFGISRQAYSRYN